MSARPALPYVPDPVPQRIDQALLSYLDRELQKLRRTLQGVGGVTTLTIGDTTVTVGVLSPDESDLVGLSWEEGNSTAYLKTVAAALGLRIDTTDLALFSSTLIELLKQVRLSTCPVYADNAAAAAGGLAVGDVYRTSGGDLRIYQTGGSDPVVVPEPSYWNYLAADRTLTSQTALQPMFGASEDTLTLSAGTYVFSALIALTGMSATSGNLGFGLLGSGSATLGVIAYDSKGIDNASAMAALGALSGIGSTASTSATILITAGTATGARVRLNGMFTLTAGGTIVPSISLTTAAAATLKAGSCFTCTRLGDAANVSSGWS